MNHKFLILILSVTCIAYAEDERKENATIITFKDNPAQYTILFLTQNQNVVIKTDKGKQILETAIDAAISKPHNTQLALDLAEELQRHKLHASKEKVRIDFYLYLRSALNAQIKCKNKFKHNLYKTALLAHSVLQKNDIKDVEDPEKYNAQNLAETLKEREKEKACSIKISGKY